MPHLSSKLWTARTSRGEGVAFWCPGCGEAHTITVKKEIGQPGWSFDGNLLAPTFSPSIKVESVQELTEEQYARVMAGEHIPPIPTCCHSFVQSGRIQFLSDCTHALAGQTVDLPDLPAEYWEEDA